MPVGAVFQKSLAFSGGTWYNKFKKTEMGRWDEDAG
jgi:hypothetical protein